MMAMITEIYIWKCYSKVYPYVNLAQIDNYNEKQRKELMPWKFTVKG